MGALFELLAQLIVATTLAALAHFGVADGPGARAQQEPPSVQRTVLQTERGSPASAVDEDCDEKTGLQSA